MSRNRECGDIKLPKLLRCPFCGGRAKLQFGYHMMVDAKVACIKCHSEGPLFGADASSGEFRPRAIAAWNKRAAVELNRPWKPIESAPKYDGSIHVWHKGDLVEAVWARCSISKNECWCYPEDIPYHGLEYYEMRPQPKSWLPIEPPSEPSA